MLTDLKPVEDVLLQKIRNKMVGRKLMFLFDIQRSPLSNVEKDPEDVDSIDSYCKCVNAMEFLVVEKENMKEEGSLI